MNKLLIIFGLMILFVVLPSWGDNEYDYYNDDDIDAGSDDDYYGDDDYDEGDDDYDKGGDDYDEYDDGERREYVAKGKFVETDGRKKECTTHAGCYDQREPQDWCILDENQSWTDIGCFCDEKLHSCVIERTNNGQLEFSYCSPQANWECIYSY